jgi:hypothetical protein
MLQKIRLYEDEDGSLYDELMVECPLPGIITTEAGSIFVVNAASLGKEHVCYYQVDSMSLNELRLASKQRMFGAQEPTR